MDRAHGRPAGPGAGRLNAGAGRLPPAAVAICAPLLQRCSFPPAGEPVVCGVSGGPDSTALLVLAVAAGCTVTAVHVDHGLRPGSAAEAGLVAELARRFGADFRAEQVELAPGPNLQARARAARLEVLGPEASLGHTADDQAETILLALVRGSGWAGLGGMTPGRRHPILGLRRAETEAVCAAAGADPLRDPSNADLRYRRSRIRHELLPLLDTIAERDIVPVLTRQAELFRDGGAVLDRLADELDVTDTVAVAAAAPVVARTAVRRWLQRSTAAPHPVDLATVDRVLAVARLEAEAAEVGDGWTVRRTDRRLRVERG